MISCGCSWCPPVPVCVISGDDGGDDTVDVVVVSDSDDDVAVAAIEAEVEVDADVEVVDCFCFCCCWTIGGFLSD